jgi:hypothetical protein
MKWEAIRGRKMHASTNCAGTELLICMLAKIDRHFNYQFPAFFHSFVSAFWSDLLLKFSNVQRLIVCFELENVLQKSLNCSLFNVYFLHTVTYLLDIYIHTQFEKFLMQT